MSINETKLSVREQREELNMFIDHTLRMMVLSEALVSAQEAEHGWWCVQFAGGDPELIPHECAMMMAYGFRLGITHYNDYQKEMREIRQTMKDDAEAEQEAGE